MVNLTPYGFAPIATIKLSDGGPITPESVKAATDFAVGLSKEFSAQRTQTDTDDIMALAKTCLRRILTKNPTLEIPKLVKRSLTQARALGAALQNTGHADGGGVPDTEPAV